MTDIARIQDFVESSRQVTDREQLHELLKDVRAELGFDYYLLIHLADTHAPHEATDEFDPAHSVVLTDFPKEWRETFLCTNVAAHDPVMRTSQDATVGFSWSAIDDMIDLTPRQRELLDQAPAYGIVDGFTIPAKAAGLGKGSCNFAIGVDRDLPRGNLLLAELVGIHSLHAAHQLIERAHAQCERPRLTPRQRDCIQLVGQGKTDWEIAQILGISPATVKDHVDDARRKYGVSKRIQIVLHAAFDGHIELSSLVR